MKNKKIWIPIIVISIIIVIVIALLIRGFITQLTGGETGHIEEDITIEVKEAKEEQLEESILVTGKIVPENEQKIYYDPENGEIIEYIVKENTTVKEGDPLFEYDPTHLDNELKNAQRELDVINNQIKSEENQIALMNQQIDQMKKDQKNYENEQAKLVEQEKRYVAEFQKYEKALAEYNALVQQVDEEEEEGEKEVELPPMPVPPTEPEAAKYHLITNEEIHQYEIERDAFVLQLDNTKAGIESAEEVIEQIEEQIENLTVKSKISGLVVKVNQNIDPALAGQSEPVIHIISDEPFKVVGTVSEFDTVKIQPDQKVTIRPKVFKDRDWSGTVESISEYPEDDGSGFDDGMYDYGGDGSLTMYPFKVKIDGDTSDLRQGFHVSLEVFAKANTPELVIPHSAIVDDMMMDMDDDIGLMDAMFGTIDFSEPSDYVFVLVDGSLEQRDVVLGNMSDEYVEVLDGVSKGELVVVNPFSDMYDGMEVESYDEIE